ncbi:MAG: putative ATP-binding cassette [Candidatus Parcubacteria bacterium]|jgi:ABC-2 type transport system permease protein
MNTLIPFLVFQYKKTGAYFKTNTLAKTVTTGLFVALFLSIGSLIYAFIVSGLRYVDIQIEEELIRQPLLLFLYNMFFLVLFLLMCTSALISGMFSLFSTRRNEWLLASPSFRDFPYHHFTKGVGASMLPFLILFVPAIVAFDKVHSLSLLQVLLAMFILVVLLIISVALSHASIFLIGKCYMSITTLFKRKANFAHFVVIIGALVLGLMMTVYASIKNLKILTIFKSAEGDTPVTLLDITSYFYLSPSSLISTMFLEWQYALSMSWNNIVAIVGIAVVSIFIYILATRFHHDLLLSFQEKLKKGADTTSTLFNHVRGTTSLLFVKEITSFMRNTKGVLWFLFLFGLWIIQIAVIVSVSDSVVTDGTDISSKTAFLQAFQFVIAMYFVAAFALRFVFPSFSVEKKTLWILGTAPIAYNKIFIGKLVFFSVVFLCLGFVMSLVNSIVLQFGLKLSFDFYLLFLSTVFFIVSFALSLGALFPSLESDEPELISTTGQGLFFTLTTLLVASMAAFSFYYELLYQNSTILYLVSSGLVLISMICVIIVLKKKKYLGFRLA